MFPTEVLLESITVLNTVQKYLQESRIAQCIMLLHQAHETAICRNPPIHIFTEDKRNLTDYLQTNI